MRIQYKVYKITNILNGKVYIGITSRRLCDRWEEHVANSRGKRRRYSKLYNAIAKYGSKSFRKEVIDRTYSEDKVRELEKIYITEYNSYNKGYNSNLGGNGHLKFPESIRKKISEAQIGKIVSEDTKRKMSLAKTGDKRCAKNFGKHTQKGAKNPRAKSYLIRFPDGSEHMVSGLLAFCRDHKLTRYKLTKNGKTKGYELLSRFND